MNENTEYIKMESNYTIETAAELMQHYTITEKFIEYSPNLTWITWVVTVDIDKLPEHLHGYVERHGYVGEVGGWVIGEPVDGLLHTHAEEFDETLTNHLITVDVNMEVYGGKTVFIDRMEVEGNLLLAQGMFEMAMLCAYDTFGDGTIIAAETLIRWSRAGKRATSAKPLSGILRKLGFQRISGSVYAM